jgi:tetratricopeptide (TPR) repeat protein
MDGAVADGCKKLRVHVLTDGRDVPDNSCHEYMATLVADLAKLEGCDAKVASGGGRMKVTMDRYEADWPMVERGWKAHVLGDAPNKFTDPVEALKKLKEGGDSDQYIEPFVIVDEAGKAVGTVEDNDAVVIANFRADRVVEISKAFEYADFNSFDRVRFPKVKFAGLMQYDGDLKLPANYLVPPPLIERTSGEVLAANGLKTFACSETQKFGHVTFFWNGLLMALGEIEKTQGSFQLAARNMRKAAERFEVLGQKEFVAATLNRVALCLMEQGKHDMALSELEEAEGNATGNEHEAALLSSTLLYKGKCLAKRDDLVSAREAMTRALQYAMACGNEPVVAECEAFLGETQEKSTVDEGAFL